MTIAEILTSWTAIITAGCVSALFMYLLICKRRKVIDWEYKHLWNPLKKAIRKLLRKSPRIVAWAEKPTKHGRPDKEWITGQIRVWGEWK
jgi:hypothetical protein